jgi:hypothetical protein
MHRRRVVEVESVATLGTAFGEKGVIVEQPELLFKGSVGACAESTPPRSSLLPRVPTVPQFRHWGRVGSRGKYLPPGPHRCTAQTMWGLWE